jgi:hypothetical protein
MPSCQTHVWAVVQFTRLYDSMHAMLLTHSVDGPTYPRYNHGDVSGGGLNPNHIINGPGHVFVNLTLYIGHSSGS